MQIRTHDIGKYLQLVRPGGLGAADASHLHGLSSHDHVRGLSGADASHFHLHGLGSVALDANGQPIIDPATGGPVDSTDSGTIADLVTKGLAILNSQQVFQLNLERAQRGLQPLNIPQPQVNLGIAGVNASTLLLIGGGLLALLLIKK